MRPREIGQIIAMREFHFANGDVLNVVIGKPEPFDNGIDFYCPWQYKGGLDETIRYSGGVDSISALLAALKSIGADLNSHPEGKSGHLRWAGSQPEDNIGLPVPENFTDLLEVKKIKNP